MRPSRRLQAGFVAGILLLGLTAALLVWLRGGRQNHASGAAPAAPEAQNPLDGDRAYGYLKDLCALGPRPSGSPAMTRQQELLEKHFRDLGGDVVRQEFHVRHPQTGRPVKMTNLLVQWRPQARERLILSTHYDTRPYPDRDPVNPQGRFVGANDGASGTALLMELGHHLPALDTKLGVDFVFFDGEEFVFHPNDKYFWGSEYFATQYVQQRPKHRYRWAVLLDMVGDADLRIYQEKYSWSWPESRPLVVDIWQIAAKLKLAEFVAQRKHEIRDDHLALRNIGKIPACNVIDFDYPYWHTEGDIPDRCSGESLAKVGWVMLEWMRSAR